MKRLGVLMAAAALGAALLASGPAEARWGGGGGWHGGGWHGGGWHGGGWGGGWGHRGFGWNRGWGYGGWGLAGLGLGLGLAGLDYGSDYPYYGYGYPGYASGYSYPGYASGYGYPGYGYAAAPLVTGRSVAIGGMGGYCSTPVKTCELYQASYIGNGCSCRVPGGHARGSVTH